MAMAGGLGWVKYRRPDSREHLPWHCQSTGSPVRLLTCKLNDIYEAISDGRSGSGNTLNSCTAEDGSLVLSEGLPLLGRRYRAEKLIGEGGFSQLVRAVDTFSPDRRLVALKVMNAKYASVGMQESVRLEGLNDRDPTDTMHVMRMMSSFVFGSHYCMVFELLDMPLMAGIEEAVRRTGPVFPMQILRKVASQALAALALLHNNDIIHADVKPENILLGRGHRNRTEGQEVNRREYYGGQSWLYLKLVDFGNAFPLEAAHVYFEDFDVQSLLYRAPEVLLGREFNTKIDVWSLGCVLAEVFLGSPLLSTDREQECIEILTSVLGPIPEHLVSAGRFFPHYSHHFPQCFQKGGDYQTSVHERLFKLFGSHDREFVSFMAGLLEYDPAKRMSPIEALRHPFLAHLFPFKVLSGSREQVSPLRMVPHVSPIRDIGVKLEARPPRPTGSSVTPVRHNRDAAPKTSVKHFASLIPGGVRPSGELSGDVERIVKAEDNHEEAEQGHSVVSLSPHGSKRRCEVSSDRAPKKLHYVANPAKSPETTETVKKKMPKVEMEKQHAFIVDVSGFSDVDSMESGGDV